MCIGVSWNPSGRCLIEEQCSRENQYTQYIHSVVGTERVKLSAVVINRKDKRSNKAFAFEDYIFISFISSNDPYVSYSTKC